MDKKMIEEMEETIDALCNEGAYDCESYKGKCFECIANMMYNAGYRKIPEGAVVLTGTEEHLEDLLIEFDEMSFYPATLMPNAEECAREWKRKLIYVIGQLRKETAEKFAERVKEAIVNMKWAREDTHIKLVTQGDCLMAVDEIYKEIIGEKK